MTIETYDVRVDTPRRFYRGSCKVTEGKNTVEIDFDLGEHGTMKLAGSRIGREFEASGTAELDGDTLTFEGVGSLWGNAIDCKLNSDVGEIGVMGTCTAIELGDLSDIDTGTWSGRWGDTA